MQDYRALVLERLRLGKSKYGHGVRVDMDTVTWGTRKNSWLEMAREEFLDGIVYVIADYIDIGRKITPEKMCALEIQYYFARDFLKCADPHKWLEEHREPDENGLIMFILDRVDDMYEGFHKKTVQLLINTIYVC